MDSFTVYIVHHCCRTSIVTTSQSVGPLLMLHMPLHLPCAAHLGALPAARCRPAMFQDQQEDAEHWQAHVAAAAALLLQLLLACTAGLSEPGWVCTHKQKPAQASHNIRVHLLCCLGAAGTAGVGSIMLHIFGWDRNSINLKLVCVRGSGGERGRQRKRVIAE